MSGPDQNVAEESRDLLKYTILRLDPVWRRRSRDERVRGHEELLEVLATPPEGTRLVTYSLVGLKARGEMLLWLIAPRLELIQEYHARLAGTAMGAYLEVTDSYLGMTRRSEYLGEHRHAGQEGDPAHRAPSGQPYLFLYPFVKRREWYSLSMEERRRIMGEHFRIGHRFPTVQIHTGYSFGIDDAEFILAFEADSPAEFLDLVEALRPSEASRYTERETPIYTAIRVPPRRMVELAEGLP